MTEEAKLKGPKLREQREAVRSLADSAATQAGPYVLGWPGDVRLPLLQQIDAVRDQGDALIDTWELRTKTDRLARQRELAPLRTAIAERISFNEDRLKELREEAAEGTTGERSRHYLPAAISDSLGAVIIASATAADYVVVQRVLQYVDTNETRFGARVLALVVSLIVLVGATVCGKALAARAALRRGPDRSDGPKDPGGWLLVASIASLLVVAVGIGALRATVVAPDASVSGFGLEARVLAGLAFIVLQVAAFVIALAVAFFSARPVPPRARAARGRIQLFLILFLGRKSLGRLERKDRMLALQVSQLSAYANASRDRWHATVREQEARALQAVSNSLNGYELLDTADETDA